MTTESTDRAAAGAKLAIAQRWGDYNLMLLKHGATYALVKQHELEQAIRRDERDRMAGLLAALREAIDTIRALHGEAGWAIYYEHAPEMQRLRAALAEGEGRAP